MKKIILAIMLMSSVVMAEKAVEKPMAKALVLPLVGIALFPGLVIGDAQWQYYTNRGNCDMDHKIITLAPIVGDGQPGRISVSIPCENWFELNAK